MPKAAVMAIHMTRRTLTAPRRTLQKFQRHCQAEHYD
jgi:hypothetical protein